VKCTGYGLTFAVELGQNLTVLTANDRLRVMQVTIDIPEGLAQRLEPERGHLAEIIESGRRLRDWIGASALAQELVSFLARGPRPQEILAFRPSKAAVTRSQELLLRNKSGALTPAEEAELDEMALLDQLVTLIKAKAGQPSHPAWAAPGSPRACAGP
jgi:hypothetical protein